MFCGNEEGVELERSMELQPGDPVDSLQGVAKEVDHLPARLVLDIAPLMAFLEVLVRLEDREQGHLYVLDPSDHSDSVLLCPRLVWYPLCVATLEIRQV